MTSIVGPAAAVAEIRGRIDAAARRAGRDPASVRIVAASKTRTPSEISALAACGGVDAFGENRVQEALPKVAALSGSGVRWHFIGQLQRNKVKDCGVFDLLHSVGSVPVVDAVATRIPHVPVLVQVNVSGEEQKSGVRPEEAVDLIRHALSREVDVRGLMTMAPLGDPQAARDTFRGLAALASTAAATLGTPLSELSMGMSDDFEIAVEEGATLVRIGRSLFGERLPV